MAGSKFGRTRKCIGISILFVTCLSMTLFVYLFLIDLHVRNEDISSEDNFKELINTDNSIVYFYSLDEVECPRLEDTWQDLQEFVQQDFKEVHVAKFDCTVYRPICTGIGVHEYPCIVWMKNGQIKERFHCRHDAESMKSFIFEMMQAKNAPHFYDGVSKIDEEELPSLDDNDFVEVPGSRDVVVDSIPKAGKDSSEAPSLVSEEHLEVNEANRDLEAPKIISARNESVTAEFMDDSIDTPKNETLSEIEADPLETNLTEKSSKAHDEEKLEIAEASNDTDANDSVKPSNENFSEPTTENVDKNKKSVDEIHEINQINSFDSLNSNEPSSEDASRNSTSVSTDQPKVEVQPHPIEINSGEGSESLDNSPTSASSEDSSSENSTKLMLEIDSNSSEESEDITSV